LKSDTTKDKEENSSCLDMKQAPLTFRQSTFFSLIVFSKKVIKGESALIGVLDKC
jgi:hypothetical protein